MKGVEHVMRKFMYSSKLFFKRNGSTILTCVGAVGVVATAVTAAKETPKAVRLLEQAREEKGEKLTPMETVLIAGPVYIPSIVLGTATVACIFGANVLNKRHQASLASAYALIDSSFKEYKNKVKELYGEEIDEEIREKIAEDNFIEVEVPHEGDTVLFYDEYSSRYFRSTLQKVQRAEYEINRDLVMRGYAYLNEFYELLGLTVIDPGWTLGWSPGANLDRYWQEWVDFGHSLSTAPNGEAYYKIIMYQEPIVDIDEYS